MREKEKKKGKKTVENISTNNCNIIILALKNKLLHVWYLFEPWNELPNLSD